MSFFSNLFGAPGGPPGPGQGPSARPLGPRPTGASASAGGHGGGMPRHSSCGGPALPAAKPAAEEVPSGGGFFNLPPSTAAGAPTHTNFGVSALAPAHASGGADLFGALSVKPTASSTAMAPGSGGFFGAQGGAPMPAADVSSGFSFLGVGTPGGAPGGAPASTGFSFLAADASRPAESGTDVSGAGGSSLLAGLSLGVPSATGPPSTLGGFSFMAGNPSSDAGIMSVGALPVAAPDVLSAGGLSSASPATVVVQPTANIKKKRGGFRPGFAREEADGVGSTGGAQSGAPAAAASSASLLSGLVVHEDGGGADEADSHAQGHDATAFGGGSTGGGGMLAGLRVHASSDVTEDGLRSVEEEGRGRKGSVASTGAPLTGMLAGLRVHNTPDAAPPVTPTAAGGMQGTGSSTSDTAGRKPSVFHADVHTTPQRASAAAIGAMEPLPQADVTPTRVPASVPAPAATPASAKTVQSRSTSPSARVRTVLGELSAAARKHNARLQELKMRLTSLLQSDRKLTADITTLSERLARMERQQDDAIRAEQFEAAESLNGTLEMLRQELAASDAKRRALTQERNAVEAEQEDAFNDSLSATTEAVMGLKRYMDDRETVLKVFRRDASARAASASDRIATEEEQLRLKEEHVALDTKLVDEETHQVERAITDQTNELESQVTALKTRHATLVAEVAELERLLEAKRREERMAASQLEDSEARIKQIHAKFDKQTKRLQVKRAQVQGEKAECDAEARSIDKEKADLAAMKRRDRAAEFGYSRQVQHTSVELLVAEALRGALLEQMETRRAFARTANAAAAVTRRLTNEIDDLQKALRGLQSNKAALEAQASSLRTTIGGIDAKVPTLNEEKKAAVAEKKFKEAGRITTELKRLTDQREDTERELSAALSSIDGADTSIAAKEVEIDTKRGALADHERTVGIARMSALRDSLRVIRRNLRRIGRKRKPVLPPGEQEDAERNSSSDTREHDPSDSALGIERASTGLTSAQVAALELLSCEQRALSDELAALGAKYGSVTELEDETVSEVEPDAPQPRAAADASPVPVVSAATAAAPAPVATVAPPVVEEPLPAVVPVPDSAASDEGPGFMSTSLAADAAEADAHDSASADLIQAMLAAHAATEEDATAAATGASGSTDTATASTSASASAAAEPAVDPALARATQLASTAKALLSLVSAIQEKEDIIADAVTREDYDSADAAQADIDSFMEHRATLLEQLSALGGSEDALQSYAADLSAAAAPSGFAFVAGAHDASAPSDAPSISFSFLAAPPAETDTPAASTGFSFMAPADGTGAAHADVSDEAAPAAATTGFAFLS